jgi:single-strand DNA-binding protein
MKGKIIYVGEVETFKSDFKKRTFAIETDDKYPQKVGFELTKDNCDLISAGDIGKTAEIQYNIRGNEYKGKYYVSLQAWKVDIAGVTAESLPTITEKQFAETHEKVKAGNVTVETVTKHYTLTMEQYATLKASEPAGADDDLPF